MSQKFRDLTAKMSPESRARAEKRAQGVMSEMPRGGEEEIRTPFIDEEEAQDRDATGIATRMETP